LAPGFAHGHGLREQQRGIADEIDSLREAMATAEGAHEVS